MRVALFLLAALGAFAESADARAQTCLRACLAERVKGSEVTDDMIRFQMTVCRDLCEEESRAKQISSGVGHSLESCEPQKVSEAEFKMLRSASASFLVYAHAFTWDIHNVLEHKVIRKVEISYPTMDLDETTATGGGTVLPGETQTILINGVFDGYPAMHYALKVRAVYACPSD
ncbi:MAG: hypothetical protein JO137_11260 [Hyphomicrobiales bacterium]|nr:hypothetical protein [Hyphomicrobiales bacterium]MBV9432389.1 hypothetical protein [Hyphomicrobiales bacterium]MBV9738236.1 hypothetical protein [Hyphomicrobiales bacterium]